MNGPFGAQPFFVGIDGRVETKEEGGEAMVWLKYGFSYLTSVVLFPQVKDTYRTIREASPHAHNNTESLLFPIAPVWTSHPDMEEHLCVASLWQKYTGLIWGLYGDS